MDTTKKVIFGSVIVQLLFLFCIFIRFFPFSFPTFSGDEAMHVKRAITVSVGIKDLVTLNEQSVAIKNIIQPILEHNHGPLEFLVLIPLGLIEPRELFVRLTYILLGSAIFLACYVWIKKMLGTNASILFLIFYGTSAYIVWWSQTAMYQSLAIGVGMLIALSMLNFYKNPSTKSLSLMTFFEALGLLTFQDFLFYVPSILWLIFDKRRQVKNYLVPLLILLSTAGLFYASYIFYGLTMGPKTAGFNYVISQKLNSPIDIVGNIRGYWNNFFGYWGVVTVWPFALLAFLFKKDLGLNKYFGLVLVFFLIIYITKSPTPFFYFSSVLGILILVATKYLLDTKALSKVAVAVVLINMIMLIRISDVRNPQIFDPDASQDIKAIGMLAKNCVISDNETYISTSDSWLTSYYFGRVSTLEKDGDEERLATINQFLEGRADQVKLIHVRNDMIDSNLKDTLQSRAKYAKDFKEDVVFVFKEC